MNPQVYIQCPSALFSKFNLPTYQFSVGNNCQLWNCYGLLLMLSLVYPQVARTVGHYLSEFIPRGTSHFTTLLGMDVIQIDSSDSDDDFGGYGRGESSYVSQEGFSHVPRLNDHVEISLWNEQEPDGTYSDKWGVDTRDPSQNKQRILPSSFQPLVSNNLPRYSNSHEGTSYVPQNEVPRNNGSNRSPMVEDITDNRHGIHSEQQLNVGKRTLPNSLQPTRPRPALEVSHSSMGTNVVGHKPYVDDGRTIDDFHMRESNGKHRHLPPSIINGENVISLL